MNNVENISFYGVELVSVEGGIVIGTVMLLLILVFAYCSIKPDYGTEV